jgi:CRISPR system Cascade subunit CasC
MTDKSSNSLFIEFHVLRSYPPSNLNRDDLGSPKSIVFGGERRVRVSSQCLKRTWRRSPLFRDVFAASDLGERTARLPEVVVERLGGHFPDEARAGLLQVFHALGRASDSGGATSPEEGGDEKEDLSTAHLLFLSAAEIDAVVAFAQNNEKTLAELGAATRATGKEKKKAQDQAKEHLKELRNTLKRFLEETAGRSAVDVSLFGRFLTSDEFKNVDGALQVAHALGTEKLDLEYDYFTAVDDRQPQGEAGAGHVGETELCASVMYEYAVCDGPLLAKNLGGDTKLAAKAMGAIARAMCRSVFEKAKKNGTAPHTPADYLEVVVRRDAPLSLANAFLKPVRPRSEQDVMDVSIAKLREQADKYDEAYGDEGVAERFRFCLRDAAGVASTHKGLSDLSKALESRVKELLG